MREELRKIITELLKEHDALPIEDRDGRNAIQRRILFLMEEIKLYESPD